MARRGRPELFNADKREKLTDLVKLGHTRRGAAVALGVSPSTVSKRIKRDLPFAEAVRVAEQISETDLLTVMRKHCEKSWLATRWLLEIKHPERYCKRKGSAVMGPSADEVFDAVIGVLDEEIADEALRQRIEARLDRLAEHEFFNTDDTTQVAVEEAPATDDESPEAPCDQPALDELPQAVEESQPSQVVELPPLDASPRLEPATAACQQDHAQPVVTIQAASHATSVVKPQASLRPDRQSARKRLAREKRLRKLRNRDRKKQLKRCR
jgi:hypothetical protein